MAAADERWWFWIDNGECFALEVLEGPQLSLPDTPGLNILNMAKWAADELDVDDSSVALLVLDRRSNDWQVVELVRGGWTVYRGPEPTTVKEITEG